VIAGLALHCAELFWVSWWAELQATRYVGFGKAEVTLARSQAAAMLAKPAGVLLALSFAHLIWHIGDVVVLAPSAAQLLSLTVGDAATLMTPPCKNDYTICHDTPRYTTLYHAIQTHTGHAYTRIYTRLHAFTRI
jgi:hypothetical protein